MVAALAASWTAAALTRAAPAKGSDLKQLQGTWVIDPAAYKDEKGKGIVEELSLVRVVFDGKTFRMKLPTPFKQNGKNWIEDKGRFRLDSSKKPKRIDFLAESGRVTSKGIYELQGDRLKLCADPDFKTRGRPTKFARGKDGKGPHLLVLIRKRK
jgi:uncharacterized protein (TIGR03067 family)